MPLTRRIPIFLTDEQLARIDDWRRQQTDLPSRAEAIRRLLNLALEIPISDT